MIYCNKFWNSEDMTNFMNELLIYKDLVVSLLKDNGEYIIFYLK